MTIDRIRKTIFLFAIATFFIVGGVACNSKTEESDEIVVTSANVAVKEFYLNANSKVLANLDSVFFSLDLDKGVIYNADSLPKGTDVTRLLATITFANTMTKADLIVRSSETLTDTTINYLTNSTDSIDFTYPVKLEVTAADGNTSFTYTIKVNVHNQLPDSIMWDKLGVSSLPSRLVNPVRQKTVSKNSNVYSLIEEHDATFTVSQSDDLNACAWDKEEISFPFAPEIDSFCLSGNTFWILSENGELFKSEDLKEWNSTSQNWENIIGGYMEGVLGIRDNGNTLVTTSYPESLGLPETPLKDNFPVKGFSPLAVIETDWYPLPVAFCAGGVSESGEILSSVWAFDGNVWETINETSLPELSDPMLAHYVIYRKTPDLFQYREFDAWLLFGGKLSDGEFNRTVYYSLDNGVIWNTAPSLMQLPEDFPTLYGADLIVADTDLTADLSDAWSSLSSRNPGPWLKPSYTLDGYDITWTCPYLYIFGGYGEDEILSDSIWRGVLARLSFTPLI